MALANNDSRSLVNPHLLIDFTHIVVDEHLRDAVARRPRARMGHRPVEFIGSLAAVYAVSVREAASKALLRLASLLNRLVGTAFTVVGRWIRGRR